MAERSGVGDQGGVVDPVLDRVGDRVQALCRLGFGQTGPRVAGLTDVNQGRGAFSIVVRAELDWPAGGGPADRGPATVVAKLPIDGPNGRAAAAAGAYRREALAYQRILADSPIITPAMYAIDEGGDDTWAFLLEDLSGHRRFDQLVGLPAAEAVAVSKELATFHRLWSDKPDLADLPVRRNTIAGLPEHGLRAGLRALETIWSEDLDDGDRRLYRRLVGGRPRLAERFEAGAVTLCHGDPRADNFAFDAQGRLVLFDWQQMAIQFGEADLAWLSATSLETEVRRAVDRDLIGAYDGDIDRYRLGLALPGLTVLLLAQRETTSERTRRFVATSLRRIAAAVDDLDVLGLT
ncbi:MAG: phosphotransferase [Acidimicrobiales bacterium]